MSPLRLFGERPVTKEERQLAVRIAAIFAIPMALIMVLPLIIAFMVYRHEVQTRLKEDRTLLSEVRKERINRTAALNQFVFTQCVNAEIRDVVAVEQYQADIRLATQEFRQTPILQAWIQTRRDGIAALEPPGETDCTPPPAVKPEGSP